MDLTGQFRSTGDSPLTHARGFTLIELIIAVSIVAILTIVAIPSYQQYVMRANRAAIKAFLIDVAQRQEAWLGDRKTYTSLTNLYGGSAPPGSSLYVSNDGTVQQSASSSTLYSVTLTRATTTNVAICPYTQSSTTVGNFDYVVVAIPLSTGSQAKDTRCATLCLSSTGIRGASGTDGASTCWLR